MCEKLRRVVVSRREATGLGLCGAQSYKSHLDARLASRSIQSEGRVCVTQRHAYLS